MKKKLKFITKFIFVLMIAALASNFIISAAHITLVTGSSMEPTYNDGDIVKGEKVKNPWDINRGDVIIFKNNKVNAPAGKLIKRIVALPGESIQIKDGKIYINGEVYEEYDFYPISDPGNAADLITLGDDEYFCIGDNNSHSTDSRSFGAVEFNEIKYVIKNN